MPTDAIDIQPGLAHLQVRRFKEAEKVFRDALAADPSHADALRLLAMLLHDSGRLEEALGLLRRAVEKYPANPAFHNNLGIVLARLNREPEAARAFSEAVRLRPDYAEALANLSTALLAAGKVVEAVAAGRKAIAAKPGFAVGYTALSAALRRQGRLAESIEVQKKGTALGLDYPEAHNELAASLEQQGRLSEAIASYKRAVELAPRDAALHSNLLFAMNYDPACKPAELFAAHVEWARRHAEPLAGEIKPHANDRSPGRRLRIGYVSADFREHTRALFMEAVLAAHDKKRFEIFCYSGAKKKDETTARIEAVADAWRDTADESDAELAAAIRADRIDILVELTGHMGHNRLLVFARKPAPVQVAYPGYPNTTGLRTIDYCITDEERDPVLGKFEARGAERTKFEARNPKSEINSNDRQNSKFETRNAELEINANEKANSKFETGSLQGVKFEAVRAADELYTEQLIRLPVTSQCYRPSDDAPAVGPSPALLRGHVTFCCFNKLVKISSGMMQAWATILSAVPRSRLMVMAASAGREDEDVRRAFVNWGVPGDRLDLVPPLARIDYLWRYNQADIALDTFPYNGHTTTLDGLWMGVPAVTLAGTTHVSREGAALLSLLGLPELIARSPKEYVDAAVKLAKSPPRLRALRKTLRKQLAESPLTDAGRLTRELESAYRRMREIWCESGEGTDCGVCGSGED